MRLFVDRARLAGLALGAVLLSGSHARASDQTLIQRGAYLARSADCVACHTKPGGAAFAGGYGIKSPLGVIYSSNITPSRAYGIGGWSEAAFAAALREGRSADGHRLYPAMPYDSYAGMSDDDIHALYAYMTTRIAPVDKAVEPMTALHFPYNRRSLMRLWNWLYLDHKRFSPGPDETPLQARGRYLVDHVAHCGTCHTPRNFMMASKAGHKLEGASLGGWYAPDIAGGTNGPLASWRDDEIMTYLHDGHVRDKAVAAGPMGEAVEHSLRYLTHDDLAAITSFLREQKRSVPAGQPLGAVSATARLYAVDSPSDRETRDLARQDRDADPAPYMDRRNYRDIAGGAALYMAACASCHQLDGAGTPDDFYPSLRLSRTVRAQRPDNLVMTILAGVNRQGGDRTAHMPAFRHDLTDRQILALVRFVTRHLAGTDTTLTEAEITRLRNLDTEDFPAQSLPPGSAALNEKNANQTRTP